MFLRYDIYSIMHHYHLNGTHKITILIHRKYYQCKETSQFKTQCKGNTSYASKTAKITVFEPVISKTPDEPLQDKQYNRNGHRQYTIINRKIHLKEKTRGSPIMWVCRILCGIPQVYLWV